MKSNVLMETGDYRHELPSTTPLCYTEPNLIFPLVSNRFQPNCGFDAVGNMFRHVLGNLKVNAIEELHPMDNNWKDKGVLRRFS